GRPPGRRRGRHGEGAAPAGRSPEAEAGHLARAGAARIRAHGAAPAGPRAHDRRLPPPAREEVRAAVIARGYAEGLPMSALSFRAASVADVEIAKAAIVQAERSGTPRSLYERVFE